MLKYNEKSNIDMKKFLLSLASIAVMLLAFTTNGWKILEVGGGFPLLQDLLQEYGVPLRVGEQLLDQTVPDWRLFVE